MAGAPGGGARCTRSGGQPSATVTPPEKAEAATYLADSTVKAHLSRAMSKLGLTSREQLAVLVDRAGATARTVPRTQAPRA